MTPDWDAPKQIKAFMTTRQGGVSSPPWDSLNLATHVGDQPLQVEENRRRLQEVAKLPTEPLWLDQRHTAISVEHTGAEDRTPIADASFTYQPNRVCAVMTADCLPLLVCDRNAMVVAAIHAGWRGLYGGVIEGCLKSMGVAADDLMVWMGVAIGPEAFEVGPEVREVFIRDSVESEMAFTVGNSEGKWLADIYQLATLRLQKLGVSAIYGGGDCSYRQRDQFFSFRREGQTGRMASLIWIEH